MKTYRIKVFLVHPTKTYKVTQHRELYEVRAKNADEAKNKARILLANKDMSDIRCMSFSKDDVINVYCGTYRPDKTMPGKIVLRKPPGGGIKK